MAINPGLDNSTKNLLSQIPQPIQQKPNILSKVTLF